MIRRLHKILGAISLLALLWASNASAQSQRPLRIMTLDWSSQIVLSYVYGELLQSKGYDIQYLSHNSDSQWFLLSTNKADLQVEVWEGTMAKRFDDLTKRKLIAQAGEHVAKTREEWWYPQYVKASCPGLPDWQALNQCAELFSDRPGERGVYYTGPWEKPDRARIRALKMKFDVVALKDSDALRQRLIQAINTQTPIVLFNWTPNWVESVYQGEFVEFPAYSPECEKVPAWGLNKDLIWDCGNPTDGWLKKAVSNRLKSQFPCAYQLISAINLNNQQIADAAAFSDTDGMDAPTAARHWIDQYQPQVDQWLQSITCQAADDTQ